MRRLSITLAVLGLMAGTLLIGWTGFGPISTALLSVGGGAFSLFCAWQLFTMGVLGLCWRLVVPPGRCRVVLPFVWGRIVRDAAGSCLPFSQLGGLVLGLRAATLHGVPSSVAALSLVADLTAEFLAEIMFALAGLVVVLGRSTDLNLGGPIVLGIGLVLIGVVAVLRLQRWVLPLLVRIGDKVLGKGFAGPSEDAGARPADDLASVYGQSGRMTLGIGGHLAGWLCKGIGNWIAFRLLGSEIDLAAALAIEALLHALLIPAVAVPGYMGVQEAGYAGIGALFGIPPEISLGVSLLRRARDITIGVPVLLIWQFVELGGLRGRRHRQARAAEPDPALTRDSGSVPWAASPGPESGQD